MLSEIVFGSAGFIGTNYLTLSGQRNVKTIEVPNQASFHNFISGSNDFGLYDMPNVIWLSGKVSPNSDPIKNKELFDWDLSSLEQTLILLHDLDWSGRFVLISSGGCVYRDMERPIKESDNLLPNNAYGELKLRQENLLLSSGLSFSILRVSNVFGPKRTLSKSGLISLLICRINLEIPTCILKVSVASCVASPHINGRKNPKTFLGALTP